MVVKIIWSRIWSGLAVLALSYGFLAFQAPLTPAHAQACDQVGGRLGGAVVGGATGSMFGRNKGRKGMVLGGAIVGGALGSRRDEQAKARCLEEREAEKDRDMQRRLDYERQRQLQEEQVRKEIEEQKLYEEWRKERLGKQG